MIALSQTKTKRLVAIHGWSGVVLGLLLYAVVLTGTVAVFAHEIGIWSVGGTRYEQPLSGPLDGVVRQLATDVEDAYLDEISIGYNSAGELTFFFHTHVTDASGQPRDEGIQFTVAPDTGEVLGRHEGYFEQIAAADRAGALDRFIVDLHVQLYVPEPWGLLLTGVLGLAMMAAAVSGLLMHRHLIRDLFVAERPGARLVSTRDRHVLAGSWGLPFAVILAFTGSFFSFAFSLGLPVVSTVAFGGDQQAMLETLVGEPQIENDAPATLADIDRIVADSNARAEAPTDFILVSHFGRADAVVSVFHPPPEGTLARVRHGYDGVTGGFQGPQPMLGTAPSIGGAIVDLMAPLHFGNFAGLLSKAAWAALGTATCFVILTGLQLWIRRREDVAPWRHLGRAALVVGYGLPIGMVGAAVAFFLTLPSGDPLFWTPMGFLIAAASCVVIGLLLRRQTSLTRIFGLLLAVGSISLPGLRVAIGGTGWPSAIGAGQGIVVSIDLLLILLGAVLLLRVANTRLRHRPAPPATDRTPEPAE